MLKCVGVGYAVVITAWQNPTTAHLRPPRFEHSEEAIKLTKPTRLGWFLVLKVRIELTTY